MKILIFIDEVYNKKNGQYVSQSNAGRFLLNLHPEHELCFAFPCKLNGEQKRTVATTVPDCVQVVELSYWNSLNSYYRHMAKHNASITKALKDLIPSFDAVWIRLPSAPGMRVAELCACSRTPVLLHFAGDIREAYKTYSVIWRFPAALVGRLMHLRMSKFVKKNAELVYPFCTGNILQESFVHPRNVFFLDVETIPSFRENLPEVVRRFIYVGRLIEGKGLRLLLDCFSRSGVDAGLDVVGTGPLDKLVKDAATRDSRVVWHGFKSGKDLNKAFSNADCLIMPTVNYPEGFPRVIAEAWCNDLVVISSDVGGVKARGKHLENMLLFSAGNKDQLYSCIKQVTHDAGLVQTLRLGGRRAAKNTSREYMLNVIRQGLVSIARCRAA